MNSGLVSVIVPIYNVEKYLDKCIRSIVNQTYSNLEIILVNDGSTDHSPEICDCWSKVDERVHVIHKANGGVSSAKNVGLHYASGEYYAFIDSDDYLDPRMIEVMIAQMEDSAVDIVECSLCEIFGAHQCDCIHNSRRMTAKEAVCHLLLWDGQVGSALWNKLFRSKVVKNVYFNEAWHYGEDTPYLYETLKKTEVYVQIPYIGYYHVRHNDSLVGENTFKPYKLHSLLAAKSVAQQVDEDYPQYREQAQCHVIINAFGLMNSVFLTRHGKKIYQNEYNEILSSLRSGQFSVYKEYVSRKQSARISFCRLVPSLYEMIYREWNSIKRLRKYNAI